MSSRKKLENAVFVDPITGGNTQTRFEMIVSETLQHIDDPKTYSIIYVNVRNFRACISRFGHVQAETILRNIYNAIDSNLDEGEILCRLERDHFSVLLHTQDLYNLRGRLSQWSETVRKFGTHSQIPQMIDLRYGIYLVADLRMPVKSMIDTANLARLDGEYKNGKTAILPIYDQTIGNKVLYHKELTDRLHQAISEQEFIIYLQPKYELTTRTIAGAEALVRWQHPSRGLLVPDMFIPILEDSGQIRELDLYVFRKTCEWLQDLIDIGFAPPPVSVNLSRYHFIKRGFIQDFIEIWQEFDIPAPLLELEFTETMLSENMDEFQKVVNHMHTIGFRCSMDDFGTGFSSLNMLCRLSVDTVKLDKQFFRDEFDIPSKESITISHVIDLIKALKMTVVAEGVEHGAQVEFLRSQGCDLVQGFFFSKPVPAEHLKTMLMEQNQI